MIDTIRGKLIKELVDLFEDFPFESVSNPTVYRGRLMFDPDAEPPPLVTVLPRTEEASYDDYGLTTCVMPVDIICLSRMGDRNPSELGEDILGELVAVVFGKQTTVDGQTVKHGGMSGTYADEIHYRSGGIDAYPGQMGQQILHVGITIAIKYQTNTGDPYTND
jgi:hypothetical protein